MKIKGVLFDLDGTLINTTPLILQSFRHTFKEFNLPVPADRELVAGFGLPLRTAAKAYMPDEMIETFCSAYSNYHREHHDELIRPFEGINEALAEIAGRGIKMAVVTSKKRPMALRGLACYGLDQYIQTVVTCQDCEEHKPMPGPSLLALKQLGLDGSDCIGVGDSPFDLQSAKGAGCLTAAVRYTSFDWNFILNEGKPDYVLNTMKDLVKLIDRINH